MKIFAVTPLSTGCEDLKKRVNQLIERKVSYVYLRGLFCVRDEFEGIVRIFADSNLVPLVNLDNPDMLKNISSTVNIHLKEHQLDEYSNLKEIYNILSISVHSFENAEIALEKGIPYVFLSPVFRPLSKPDDKRQVLNRKGLAELVDRYGERVVLLGGMTFQRVSEMKQLLGSDFSYAGITMFWSRNESD